MDELNKLATELVKAIDDWIGADGFDCAELDVMRDKTIALAEHLEIKMVNV